MRLESGAFYHVFNRGNNKARVFYSRENYTYFQRKIKKHLLPHASVLAYCLMPNHFHLMIELHQNSSPAMVSGAFRTILSSYTRGINRELGRTGSLFQQNTKACDLAAGDIFYGAACFAYIHQNPVRAGMVTSFEEWEFSSYIDHIVGAPSDLCDVARAQDILDLPIDPHERRRYFFRSVPSRYIALMKRA